MNARLASSAQRGMALITSLLLLLVVTILAVSMFRSFGLEGRIAGNVREKQRALMAAESAQQYAEWWLAQGSNALGAAAACSGTLDANANDGQICNDFLLTPANVNSWPGFTTYLPTGMVVNANKAGTYYKAPAFHITDMGVSADGSGEVYQIDAMGYGADANTVAVVESTFAVQQGVQCNSCPPEG
jgi:type IV pilus assembly protein PilX